MKVLFVILFLGVNCSYLQGQDFKTTFSIRGIVKDKISDSRVPFVSISIVNTQRGTSADEEGKFFLIVSKPDIGKKIKISCIGYETRLLSVDEIRDSTILYLNPAVSILNEISIHGDSINSVEIIKKAIKNIQVNYRQQPFGLEFFSEIEVVNILSQDVFKVESILQGYYGGYIPSGRRKFEITHARMTGKDPLDGYYIPTHEIYAIDVIANPDKYGIFNEENLTKIKFHYEGSTIYESDTVYNIAYTIPTPTKKITGYGVIPKYFKGHVTITDGDYAIVEHKIVTDRVSSQIRYRKIDGYFFPYSILGTRNQIPSEQGISSFTMTNQLRLLNVVIENINPLTERSNEVDFSKVNYDKQFWELNYPK